MADTFVVTAPFNLPVSLSRLLAGSGAGSEFVPIAGNVTMTGPLTLSGDATQNLEPVTLQQLNAAVAELQAQIDALKPV